MWLEGDKELGSPTHHPGGVLEACPQSPDGESLRQKP